MKNELRILKTLLLHTHGMDISMYDESFLMKSLEKRLSATSSKSPSEYNDYLRANKTEASALLDSLNINFSEFFRNPLTFAYLEQVILPLFIEKKKRSDDKEIRIWSAACASGQEAYSIAMLCHELIEGTKANITCRIFATDIIQSELVNAGKGIYSTLSLNKLSFNRIQTYFTKKGESYVILPKIKKYVDFSIFDLLQEETVCPSASIYGDFDLVFCSNLLFYYNPEHRQQILNKMRGCLSLEGYLITGESERNIARENNYHEVFVNSSIFQKR